MHIMIVNTATIPVFAYGGTERVIWDLGKTLVALGHQVSYLVPEGSSCDFATVYTIQPNTPWHVQIPQGVDIVHFQFHPTLSAEFDFPYLVTEHGNNKVDMGYALNTVFVSRNHAERHGSTSYVYNGLDWDAYGAVDFSQVRTHYHFLGKGAWRVKNLQGAIDTSLAANVELDVLGGTRLNIDILTALKRR